MLVPKGGGIPRHTTDHLFHYLFSTAPRPSMSPTKAPLAGYGYGLPLSRLYARYFHGDLILNRLQQFFNIFVCEADLEVLMLFVRPSVVMLKMTG